MKGQRTTITRRARIKAVSSAVWLRAFVVVICLAIVVLEVWRDWSERNDVLANTERVMADLAHSLVQHAQDTLEMADAVLVDIVSRVETGGALQGTIEWMDGALTERIKTLPRFKSLNVFGDDGVLRSSSLPGHNYKVSSRDLAFFRHHSASPNRSWFLGPLIADPVGGDWILTLSRRFDKPDGNFGGVVAISIAPRYFSNFYAQFNVGEQGSIVLFSGDGTILARHPYRQDAIGRDALGAPLFKDYLPHSAFGSYSVKSFIDGVARISGYRRNHVFPVVVMAAVGREETLAGWNRDFRFRAVGVTVLIAVIGILGWSLAGQLRRREKAEAELAVLAATDGLTGLANRRTFDNNIETEWLRAKRAGAPISLLLLDIDSFKSFNDTYGHQAGDESLQAVARILANTVNRPGDLAARYGGEELAVLLPATDSREAAALAEIIRVRVEALAVRHESSTPLNVLTISIGSATLMPAAEPHWATPEKLVALADRALYRAKLEGRNRTAIYEAARPDRQVGIRTRIP